MKSVLMILAVIITFCSFQRERCWDCRVTCSYQSTPNASPVEDSTYRICGDTKKMKGTGTNKKMRRDSGFINAQGVPDTVMFRTSLPESKRRFGRSANA